MPDLPECEKDIVAFKGAMEKFGITNPDDVYELKDPQSMQALKTMLAIKNRLKENPDVNHLIIYVAAGHGMNKDGQQVLVVNQYD